MRRYHRGFSAPFSLPVLKDDRVVFGKLVGAATNQLMTPCQKGNANYMSNGEITPTILGIAQMFDTTRHEEYWRELIAFCSGRFCSRYLLVAHILSWVTEIFFCKFVYRLLSYLQVLFKKENL